MKSHGLLVSGVSRSMDTSDTTYNIVFRGNTRQGFETEQVERAFSELFKLPLEKSQRILRKPRTLKKNLSKHAAERMRNKLEQIGLEVTLEPLAVENTGEFSLSLVPMEGEVAHAPLMHDAEPVKNTLNCPACGGEVASLTDPCPHCGVYPHKVISRSQPQASLPTCSSDIDDGVEEEVDDPWDGLTIKGVLSGAVAALIGAMLWKGIAIAIDYELGLIAWAIGGGIGFVVAFSGSRGQAAAVYCGVLALVAILGGKYLFYADLQSNLGELLAGSADEFHALYAEELADAEALESVSGEEEQRSFMLMHGYTEARDTESISWEELEQFQNETMPRLMSFADMPPSYEEWYQTTIEANLSAVSPTDLMKESFDFIDALFLFLGISTAAKVGYGRGRSA
ncbi:MAG: hypothetical protein ABW076_15805 [Candidatus Thiodiazotropha sp.]